jgi:hypothetical protein
MQKSLDYMYITGTIWRGCLLAAAMWAGTGLAGAQGTAFTYQGRLTANGGAANGSYDFRFRLATDPLADHYSATPYLTNGVPVANGIFTTIVDFGEGVFNGSNYWLEVDVRTNGNGGYTQLTPLQAVTPTPYAILANSASNLLGNVSSAQLTGSLPVSQVSGTVPLGQLPADVLTNFENNVTLSNANLAGVLSLDTPTYIIANYGVLLGADSNRNFFAGDAGNWTGPVPGSFNAGVGYWALTQITNGSFNSAFGYAALEFTTTGSNNIALGYQAGSQVLTGSSNIDIGNIGSSYDTNLIRIGAGQSDAYIAGKLHGDGSGLINLNATNLAGIVPLAKLPPTVVTDNDAGVNLSNVTLSGSVNLTGGSNNVATLSFNDFPFLTVDPYSYCVGLGPSALQFNTGSKNTADGGQALGSAIGDNNTASGFNALGSQAFQYYGGSAPVSGNNNTADGVNALSYDSSGSDNTGIGVNALQHNSAGSLNIAVGSGALISNISGGQNVAVGYEALYAATNDSELVAIGYNALAYENAAGQANSSGFGENTAVGYQSMQADTSGYSNTGLGFQSMLDNTSGIENVAVGVATLVANQTGNYNVAVGSGALYANGSFNTALGANSMGSAGFDNDIVAVGFGALEHDNAVGYGSVSDYGENTAVGTLSLNNDTTGFGNTAAGYQSLSGAINNDYETAVGDNALQYITNGYGDVAIGAYAGSGATNADYNTFIGFSSGSSLASGTGNILIGYFSGDDLNSDNNNNIEIGNQGVATDNNVIRIGAQGTQTITAIAGIYGGVLPTSGGPTPVYVDNAGHLGTVFNLVQSGQATMPSSSTVETNFTVTFPHAFSSPPKVIASLSGDPIYSTAADTFAMSIRAITSATGFTINVYRIDAPTGWAQQLRVNWQAWQ